MIDYLTLEDVLALVSDLGVGPVRDIGLLDSAVHRPSVTVFGRDCILRWVRAAVPRVGEPVFRVGVSQCGGPGWAVAPVLV